MSKKISDLTSATTPLAGTELLEIVQSGTSKKVAASSLLGSSSSREKLSAARTYYVRTDGSDSNDGLSNTSGGAFLTIQKAIDAVYQIDLSIYNVTVQIGDGTYTSGFTCSGPIVGSGTLTIQGNSGTPTNVVLSTGSNVSVIAQYGATITVTNLKVTNTAIAGIQASKKGHINFSGIDFGSVTSHQIRADDGGSLSATGNYTISGGAAAHMATVAAGVIRIQSKTITLSGTPAYSTAFADINFNGTAIVNGNTYSGSATGVRYSATMNGVIYVGGGGANYFPGNSAGSTATGGQYA